MSDVFITCARATAVEAESIDQGLTALGYGVCRDDRRPAQRSPAEVVEERLRAANALVVWSAAAVKVRWAPAGANLVGTGSPAAMNPAPART